MVNEWNWGLAGAQVRTTLYDQSRPQVPGPGSSLLLLTQRGAGGPTLTSRAAFTPQHRRLEVGVAAGMLDQMVAAHEALIAQWAQEALFSGVGASVTRQLVRAGKLLVTVWPGAGEGPLTWSREQNVGEKHSPRYSQQPQYIFYILYLKLVHVYHMHLPAIVNSLFVQTYLANKAYAELFKIHHVLYRHGWHLH